MIALIDGDIIAYRVACTCQTENDGEPYVAEDYVAQGRANQFVEDLLASLQPEGYEGYLTGEGNFRTGIAKTAPYKGNRKQERPVLLDTVREHLVERWGFEVTEGEEADDRIAIRATELGRGAIICSIDKDFNQVPGEHYNFVKRERYSISDDEGLCNFYRQIVTGDSADNIVGVRGIGPVLAGRLIVPGSGEQAYFSAGVRAFGGELDRVIENGQLLWLRRFDGQLWYPSQSLLDLVPDIIAGLQSKPFYEELKSLKKRAKAD